MKRLLAILSVILFANQASAVDSDDWVGFECSRFDFEKQEYINTLPFPEFFAVNYNKDQHEIYHGGTYYRSCDDSTFFLFCEDERGFSIEIHKYTSMVTWKFLNRQSNYYRCNLVEKKF